MPTDGLRDRLRDRELQLRTAQEMAEFGIWEWDIPAGTVTWSDQLHAIYGTTPGEHVPSYESYIERVHPDDRTRIAGAIQRALGDHQPFSFDERIVRPSGEVRILNSRGRVVTEGGKAVRMIGVCQDVTVPRGAEERIREALAKLEEAQSIARIGSWDWDIPGDVVTWSNEMFRIYGVDRKSFTPSYNSFLEMVHPEDRGIVDQVVRDAFAIGGDFHFEHRVVRPDGTVRTLDARGRTISGPDGHPVRMVGTERDISEQREAEAEAAAAAAALETANRIERLHRITEVALSNLSLAEVLPALLDRVCEAIGVEHAAMLLAEPGGEMLTVQAACGAGAAEVGSALAMGEGFAGRVAMDRKLLVVERDAHSHLASTAVSSAGLQSVIGVPLVVNDQVLGVLTVGSSEQRSFEKEEIALVELAAERAALAIDHARVFDREREIAETLQRALLPDKLPRLDRASVAVRYVPAAGETEVGGDWYDVIALPGGDVGVALGDVTGHGIAAAALMAQLRHSLRAYATDGRDPATVAQQLDALIHTPDLERLATLVYAIFRADLEVEFVVAGHLPPLLVGPGGRTRFLETPGGVPIGCQAGGYATDRVTLEPGELMVLYTDGLIERRGESIGAGMERLRLAAAGGPSDPEGLADHLLRKLMPSNSGEDDIAVLAIRPVAVPARPAV